MAVLTLFRRGKEFAMLTPKKRVKRVRSRELVAVCSWCRKIRIDSGIWLDPGLFFNAFEGRFTHTICEQCSNLYFPEFTTSTFESCQQVDPQ
jgi:hypothetical protein